MIYTGSNNDLIDFPTALKACLEGNHITNEEWNGKDMYVFMMPGYLNGVPANKVLSENAKIPEGKEVIINPYLMMKNAKGEYVNWLISQMDVFSKKWKILKSN